MPGVGKYFEDLDRRPWDHEVWVIIEQRPD